MIIGKDKQPRLQLDDAAPLAVAAAEVRRDVEHSTLTNVVRDGASVTFPPGARVTLWAGPSVVFVGKAVDEHQVLDLISSAGDDELADDGSI